MLVDYVKCYMCNDEWILASHELVCDKCKPKLNIDIAVADLKQAVSTLETHEPDALKHRIGMLINLSGRLDSLIKKVRDV